MSTFVYSRRHRIPRNILLFLTTCLFFFSSLVGSYNEAHAFVPALLLASEATAIVGTILVAAGLTYATDYAIGQTVNWFWGAEGPAIRNSIATAADSIQNGVMNVTADVWQSVKGFVNTNFNVGSNSVQSPYLEGVLDGKTYPYSVSKSTVFSLGSTFVIPATANYVATGNRGKTIYLDMYTHTTGEKYWMVLVDGAAYPVATGTSDDFGYTTRQYTTPGTGYDLYLYRENGVVSLRVQFVNSSGAVVSKNIGALQTSTRPNFLLPRLSRGVKVWFESTPPHPKYRAPPYERRRFDTNCTSFRNYL